MSNLEMAASRLARAAASLDGERQRDGGPRSAEVRRIGDDVFTAAGDLIAAAYDIDAAERAGR